MNPARKLDAQVAEKVLGHKVVFKSKKLIEETPLGERPLRFFDTDLNDAMEVAEKMNISLLAVTEGWFAFAGPKTWASPNEMLEFLNAGNFEGCGAAVGKHPARVICHAAINAVTKRESESEVVDTQVVPEAMPSVSASEVETRH